MMPGQPENMVFIAFGTGIAILLAGLVAFFRPLPLFTNRWRAGGAIAAGLIVTASAILWRPDDGRCGCQLPPIPNILLLEHGAKLMTEGDYAAAKDSFNDVIEDERSAEIRGAAIYGRALSEKKLGETAAAQNDLAAAAAFNPSGATQFYELNSQHVQLSTLPPPGQAAPAAPN
jgi:hypothetical protein